MSSTIIACSSGTGINVAISVIRISGTGFLDQVNPFFKLDLSSIEPGRVYYTDIVSGVKKLDDVVITFFRGPNSYNGEDILEISCHGNRINVERIISLFVVEGKLSRAKPGEFTERALKNKKMTLSQVEGLDLLLNASNIFSLEQGFSLMRGDLQKLFLDLHKSFIDHRSALELGFDFLEDVGEEAFNKNLNETFKKLKNLIGAINAKIENDAGSLINPEIVLFGPPNAGKSTLFNLLLSEDRAIVSNIAGTTRDFISESLQINGNYFRLIDTAGIREASDEIEKIGISRTKDLVENAFYKLLLINPGDEIDPSYFKNVDYDLVLLTHTEGEYNLSDFFSGPIGPISTDGPIGPVHTIDLLNKPNLEKIKASFEAKYLKLLNFDPILLERHRESIKYIYNSFESYEKIFNENNDLAIVGSELNSVGVCISELIGIVSPEEILNNIFSNFCIGK